jgi:hypothetical protein
MMTLKEALEVAHSEKYNLDRQKIEDAIKVIDASRLAEVRLLLELKLMFIELNDMNDARHPKSNT